MEFHLTYNDYLWGKPRDSGEAPDGQYVAPMSREEWDALDEDEQVRRLTQGFFISSRDSRWDAMAEAVGETDRRNNIYIGRQNDWNFDWMDDRDRYVDTDNGYRFSTSGNTSAQWDADNDFGIVQHGWLLPVAAAGAAFLGGASMAAGGDVLAAGAGEGFGTGAIGAGTTDVGLGLGASEAGNIVAPGGGTTPPPVPGGGGGVPLVEVPPNLPQIPPTTVGTTPLSPSPIINGSRGVFDTALGWYNDLSPAARQIIGTGVGTGIQAGLGANAQREAQEEANRREQEQEEDRIRRGGVPAFGYAYTPRAPRSTGIINGSRTTPQGPISRTGR